MIVNLTVEDLENGGSSLEAVDPIHIASSRCSLKLGHLFTIAVCSHHWFRLSMKRCVLNPEWLDIASIPSAWDANYVWCLWSRDTRFLISTKLHAYVVGTRNAIHSNASTPFSILLYLELYFGDTLNSHSQKGNYQSRYTPPKATVWDTANRCGSGNKTLTQ